MRSDVVDGKIRFPGRILFLYEDLDLVRAQLDGQDIPWLEDQELIHNISTDEITPGWVCFYFDETLGEYSLVGLRGGRVGHQDIKGGGFSVIVSGRSKGCGSSQRPAYSEQAAGIRLVIAKNIEKIYGNNCQNIGLLTSTDFGLIPRILRGEAIEFGAFTEGLDPVATDIVQSGGLFAYNKRRLAGEVAPPALETATRPLNLVEKVIAQRHRRRGRRHHGVDGRSRRRGGRGTGIPVSTTPPRGLLQGRL